MDPLPAVNVFPALLSQLLFQGGAVGREAVQHLSHHHLLLAQRLRVVPPHGGLLQRLAHPGDRLVELVKLDRDGGPVALESEVQLAADVTHLDRDVVLAPFVEVVVTRVDHASRGDDEAGALVGLGVHIDRQPSGLKDAVVVDDGDAARELADTGLRADAEQGERAVAARRQQELGGSKPNDR